METLEVLTEILCNFGNVLISYHSQLLSCLVQQLHSQRLAVRKRAINALSYLIACSNNTIFQQLLQILLDELKKKKLTQLNKTYIQCLSSISKQSGNKIGENLELIIPLVVYYSQSKDDELIEYSLQAFESFVKRCPSNQMHNYIKDIISLCLKYVQYDPNYNYDNDDDEIRMETDQEEGENEEEDENDDDNEYSDDDDVSWKIRRAAAKCLEAIINTRHEQLQFFYTQVAPLLINRFKEREETVRCDLFNVYLCILQQTKSIVNVQTLNLIDDKHENTLNYEINDKDYEIIQLLKKQIPVLLKSVQKLLKDKSIKSRQCVYLILTQICTIIPNGLSSYISTLINGVQYSLLDDQKHSTSNMKIDALNFLLQLLATHDNKLFYPHLEQLINLVIVCVQDNFYKIVSDSLLVSTYLTRICKTETPKNKDILLKLYDVILKRLKQTDIDQEVKERAITSMAHLISNLSNKLGNEVTSSSWSILIERLKNEITRLTTIKAIKLVTDSQQQEKVLDLKYLLNESVPLISSYLRKNHRTLRLASINCLLSIYKYNSSNITSEQLKVNILPEVALLISDNDLHITQVTLKLLTLVCKLNGPQLIVPMIPQLLLLIQSPLLQGLALESLIELYQEIVRHNYNSLTYKETIHMLTKPIYNPSTIKTKNQPQETSSSSLAIHKQAFYSIAKCIANLTVDNKSINDTTYYLIIKQFINDIKSDKSSESIKLLCLLCLGETGKYIELNSKELNETPNELEKVILNSFSSNIEEVKSAASYALGYLSLGNLNKYIPFILNEINLQTKKQYLLLNSLKEIINYLSTSRQQDGYLKLKDYLNEIWLILMKNSECNEEGTRNVVAECLGKLILLRPNELMPKLLETLDSSQSSANVRSTIVTAIKFTITDQPNKQLDDILNECFVKFLNSLKDNNLNVRRVALITFNSAAHNKPKLVRSLLLSNTTNQQESFLTYLYNETKIRKELIREVEMGPFKHTVDDGLDLRKAAFECMYTLLDSCLDCIDIFEFINHVEDGLKDHYDIKMLTYLMLIRLAHLCPNALLQRLDRLIEPLKNACIQKVRTNAVKQEYEKNDELKRSALRALNALNNIPDAGKFLLNIRIIENSVKSANFFSFIQT